MKMNMNLLACRGIAMPIRWLMASGALLGALPAFAVDPTVSLNFTGTYLTTSCSVSGGTLQTVTLPRISTTALGSAGQTAGSTPFGISVECYGEPRQLRVYFTSTMMRDGRLDTEAGAGMAENVQIQLLTPAGTPISVGDRTSMPLVPVAAGVPIVVPFVAQYYATGATSAGNVRTQVLYVLEMP